jgi:hypothetical protein
MARSRSRNRRARSSCDSRPRDPTGAPARRPETDPARRARARRVR